MTTVYLDRKNLHIELAGGCLKLAPAPRGRGSIPLDMISRLVLCGRVEFSSSTLGGLAERGIAVICLGGRNHRRVAQITGNFGNDVTRRIHQFQVATDDKLRLRLGRQIVLAKIRSTRRELGRLLDRRPDRRYALAKASRTVDGIQCQIEQAGKEALLGLEGAAAAAWFQAMAAVVPASLEFTGRNRRPPRDPFNAALSLGYTLLHAEAVAACHAHGFDPMLGFLHEPAHGRESLACDLIEPLRPRLDSRLLSLFARRELTAEHFSVSDQGCRLSKTGRRHFYVWWESIAPAWRRYLRTTGHGLVHQLEAMAA